MSLMQSFQFASSGVMAQSARLNAVASNMANADTAAEPGQEPYRARKVIFESLLQAQMPNGAGLGGVGVKQVVTDNALPRRVYDPKHAMADNEGYVNFSNVNAIDEMVDMIAASRSYQMDIEMMNTAKTLMLKTININQ